VFTTRREAVEVVRTIHDEKTGKGGHVMTSTGLLLGSGIVVELAGLVLLGKALATGSSPTLGIVFVAVGIVFVAVGLVTRVGPRAIKAKNGEDALR